VKNAQFLNVPFSVGSRGLGHAQESLNFGRKYPDYMWGSETRAMILSNEYP